MFPNTPETPEQPAQPPAQSIQPSQPFQTPTPPNPFTTSPPPTQPQATPPEKRKSKKWLLIVGILVAVLLIVGVLLWLFVFSGSGKSSSNNSANTQANKSQSSSDLGVDCDGKPNPNIGQWQKYLVSKSGEYACGVQIGNLWTTLYEVSSTNSFVVVVLVDEMIDPPQPGHEVSITNIEYLCRGEVYKVADHILPDDRRFGEGSDYRKSAQVTYDSAKVMNGAMWEKAFGKQIAFEDMFQAFSPSGNSLKIAPAYTYEECPDCRNEQDHVREVRFAVDEQSQIQAVKFDLTVDGKTRTVAFATDAE